MTNLNYGEMATCELTENKPETAKAILENMNAVLKQLSNELHRIEDVIYSPRNVENSKVLNEPTEPEGFLETLNRQRNVAGDLLHRVVHIREGLL